MSETGKQCRRCVLDTTVGDITFDESGICNYCHSYDAIIKTVPEGEAATQKLNEIIEKIKREGRGQEYDCIIGISGGVDSTYLADLVIKNGLRPLAVHVDTGWNSEIATQNIQKLVEILDIDLMTFVIDWQEMKDLQLSFFKASLPDCDIPQDHVFPAVLHKLAKKYNIKSIISGHNIVTEFILPRNWSYNSNDLEHILDVHKKFGTKKLSKYPKYSFVDKIKYHHINKIRSVRLLYYVPYNKDEVKDYIIEKLGWKDYGGKHFESRFTKFFQSYYLPTKFGFDKRKAHLSNLIISGQTSKEEALKELAIPSYDIKDLGEDLDYITRKLGVSIEEWEEIMKRPPLKHHDYRTEQDSMPYKLYSKIKGK